jgi:DinB superfamily
MPYTSTDELVAALADVPDRVEASIRQAGATAASEAALPSEGADAAWTANQVLGHLCDSARYWGARMFRVVREDEPLLPGIDQDALMLAFAHKYRSLDELLATLRLVSAGNVALLRVLPAEAWERAGTHEERGRMTLRELVEVETDHELLHLRHLRAALGLGAE